MIRIIWDNGSPSCLPKWARDEIVRRRLAEDDAVHHLIAGDPEAAARALGASEMVARHVGKKAKGQ